MWNYKIDYTKEMVTYDGNLEEDLIKAGVPKERIEKAKTETVLYRNEIPYYDSYEPECEIKLVPVSKIVGFSRGAAGRTMFDNVNSMRLGDREPTRFISALTYLSELGYEGVCKSYKELTENIPKIDYYNEDDIYAVNGDGNHRTLLAKLIGATYIKARVTTRHCNYELRSKYDKEMEFRKQYGIVGIKRKLDEVTFYFEKNGEIYRSDCFDDCFFDDFDMTISALKSKIRRHEWLQQFFKDKPKILKDIYKYLSGDIGFDSYQKAEEDWDELWTNGLPTYLYKII